MTTTPDNPQRADDDRPIDTPDGEDEGTVDPVDVTDGMDGWAACYLCKEDNRTTLTRYPVCQRCYNETSADKLTLPHWSDIGEPVN